MSYNEFLQQIRLLAKQAELTGANLANDYKRLVEILEANPDNVHGAEVALWEEFEKTKNTFYQRKAWDLRTMRS